MSPFDIVSKVFNEKQTHDKDEVLATYPAWVINKALSNTMDTMFFSAEMNRYSALDNDMQYAFYLNGIPKGKRFGKWNKIDTSEKELLNNVCRLYSVNTIVAKQYLTLLSEEEKQRILSMEGGMRNGRTKNGGVDRT